MKLITLFITIFISSLVPTLELERKYISKTKIDVAGNMSFARFLNHFDKVDMPKDIDHTEIQKLKSKLPPNRNLSKKRRAQIEDLRGFIPELINGSFSRMGPPEVEPLSRFYPDENTIAVTYLTKHRFIDGGFNVRMVIFDLNGNNITDSQEKNKRMKNSRIIAGLHSDKTILCSFSNSNLLSTTTYKNIWKKDIKEFYVDDNSIASYEKEDSNDMIIRPNGDIVVIEQEVDLVILK